MTSLSSIIRKMGNLFLADFSDLVPLDSQDCAHESVITALYTLEDTGKGQYSNFVKEVLEQRKRSIHEPIKLNKAALFRKPSPKIKSKQGKKIKALENNVSFWSVVYLNVEPLRGLGRILSSRSQILSSLIVRIRQTLFAGHKV